MDIGFLQESGLSILNCEVHRCSMPGDHPVQQCPPERVSGSAHGPSWTGGRPVDRHAFPLHVSQQQPKGLPVLVVHGDHHLGALASGFMYSTLDSLVHHARPDLQHSVLPHPFYSNSYRCAS